MRARRTLVQVRAPHCSVFEGLFQILLVLVRRLDVYDRRTLDHRLALVFDNLQVCVFHVLQVPDCLIVYFYYLQLVLRGSSSRHALKQLGAHEIHDSDIPGISYQRKRLSRAGLAVCEDCRGVPLLELFDHWFHVVIENLLRLRLRTIHVVKFKFVSLRGDDLIADLERQLALHQISDTDHVLDLHLHFRVELTT